MVDSGSKEGQQIDNLCTTSVDELEKFCDSEFIAVDTETNGLDTNNGFAISVALCNMRGETRFVHFENSTAPELYDLEVILGTKKCVFHNAKFDIKMLGNRGFSVTYPEDTIIMAYLINEYEPSLSLEFLAKKYIGEEKFVDEKFVLWKKMNRVDFNTNGLLNCPIELLRPYNIHDAVITLKLFFALKGRLSALHLNEQYGIEKQLLKSLIKLERRGCKIDVNYGLTKLSTISEELSPLEQKIKSAYHIENLRSWQQVKRAFEQNGIFVKSTNKEVLADLAARGNPIADDLITYRKKSKLLNTYIVPILQKTDQKTHRLHANYNQAVTHTHRLSSSDPNLQNIPKPAEGGKYEFEVARRLFICEENSYLIGGDYDQEEMRIIADECNCSGLLELFKAGYRDVYVEIARIIWPSKEIDKRLRYIAKQNVLGTSYGMGPTKFTIQSKRYGVDVSVDEAVYVIGVINERFPEIKETLQRYSSIIRRQGFIVDRFGMRYNIPQDFSYKALNGIIQGTAAQVMKRALIAIDEISSKNFGCINTIHDEFLVEVNKEITPETAIQQLKEKMESVSVHFKIPLTASIKQYDGSWGMVKKAA